MIDKKRKNIKTDFSFLFINYRKKRKNSSQKKRKIVAQNCLNKERKSARSKRTFSFEDFEFDFYLLRASFSSIRF